MDSESSPLPLSEYARVVLAKWLPILIVSGILAIALAGRSLRPNTVATTYTARVESLVPGRTGASSIPAPSLADDSLLFTSDVLVKVVATKLGRRAESVPAPAVTQIATTSAFELSLNDRDAGKILNTFAEEWVRTRNNMAQTLAKTTLEGQESVLRDLRDRQGTLEAQLETLVRTGIANEASERQIEAVRSELFGLSNQIASQVAVVRSATDASKAEVARVMQRARRVAAAPASAGRIRSFMRNGITGGMLGGMLAVGAVLGLHLVRGRISGRKELEVSVPGIPVLGTIAPDDPAHADRVIEDVRRLRSALDRMREQSTVPTDDNGQTKDSPGARTFLIVSVDGSDAAVKATVHLSMSWSRSNVKVRLVDACRDALLTQALPITPTKSLAAQLSSSGSIDELSISPAVTVVASMPETRLDAAERLTSKAFRSLLNADDVDTTVVVTDGVLDDADAVTVARFVDGVVLVVPARTASKTDVREAVARLSPVATFAGMVLADSLR